LSERGDGERDAIEFVSTIALLAKYMLHTPQAYLKAPCFQTAR
jgi:hypothetical protein